MSRVPLDPAPPILVCGNSQGRPHPNEEERLESDAFVQVPVLHSSGYHQPPDGQDIGVFEVLKADLAGKDTNEMQEDPGVSHGAPGPMGYSP